MGNVYFCSDLHIGHKNIANFRKFVTSEQDNRDMIKQSWDKLVTKRDLVFCLGDSAFDDEAVNWMKQLKGEKRLIKGNHCHNSTAKLLEVFSEVHGFIRYKKMWLGHAPIHPDELRGKFQLHGHCHYHNIQRDGEEDRRYLNCCPENLRNLNGECLISLDEVRKYFQLHTGFRI